MTDPQHTAASVRRSFLEFFEAKAHRIVPSGPVFPSDDPTLLFTNAGMNQFKDVFLGTGSRDYSRAVDTQKCIRVQGKHNDLEEVGVDSYHHTFFEMLGNWSFGDYFKQEAITWAWELLTEVWQLPKERLWVTVFAGDEADGLPADVDAERLWLEDTDIDPTHVLRFDRRDNFWEMGESGPCGPCTEIHIDRGGPDSNPLDGADPAIGVNAGNERFIELWNLVFIQFNRQDDGSLVDLPAKHVDTGMGFERVLSVLQGKSSNYDTDLFTPIFRALEARTGKTYGQDETVDVAFRVCADHVRAVTSALADGAEPSNEGRGYVLRRLIRRASRYGLQALGMEEPFLFEVVPAAVEILGPAFPEIADQAQHVQLVVESEEASFRRTLRRGLAKFEKLTEGMPSGATLPGKQAFELYATDGFPQDLVELMARERGLEVDLDGWAVAAAAHSDVSKGEGSFKQLLSAEQVSGLSATRSTYHGSDETSLSGEAEVLRHFQEAGQPDRLVLDASPFYPESGGQVGDQGTIEGDGLRFTVESTRKLGELVVHVGRAEGAAPEGAAVRCEVDRSRRAATRANHTATHLLHRALREVLGDHVTQKGSYVGPDRLRFDFSNPQGVKADELVEVERRVNAAVRDNQAVVTTVEAPEEAKARGVMALFGEKYGDRVRVVDVGGWSTELCGGTHVARAGDIGPFVILSEQSISAGVRRIEGLTGAEALAHIQGQRALLERAAAVLKTKAEEVPERIEALQKQLKDAKKKQKQAAGADLGAELASIKAELEKLGGVPSAVLDRPGLGAGDLKDLGDRLKAGGPDLALAIFGRDGDKVPFLIVCLGKAQEAGLKAGDLARGLKPHLGGGGGGRPDLAQGQGARAQGVPEAIEAVSQALHDALA
jgi:alanyl-tRNA synthetase